MDVLWPATLFLFVVIPLTIAAYIWALRRRRLAVRYSSLSLVRAALPGHSRLRQHLPFVLFLLALASLIFALSRPVAIVSVPANQTTIILAMDVSRSMCSTDILPSRLEAAEVAALSFIERQKYSTQIGIVAFSGFAELIQPPTTDPEALQAAVESLMTGRRTAIGSAILEALDAIAEIDPNVAPSVPYGSSAVGPTPVPRGAYVPDIIVLLTDGVSNAGPEPLDAAQQALERGVRVYTIGFGTANGSTFPNCPDRFTGNEPFGGGGGFGGGGFGGGGFRRGIDEATLKEVAAVTGGEYYSAESTNELQNAFQNLPISLITKHETTEISVFFTALGVLLAVIAVGLALLWRPLP